MNRPEPIAPRPGQESVWDYPRPPVAQLFDKHIVVRFGGLVVADSTRAIKVMETSHPPVYYIPPEHILLDVCEPSPHHTFCEYKGLASYYHLRTGASFARNAGWFYPEPSPGYELLRDHVAFYPKLMDECSIDGEVVTPQPGRFYGGWITRDIVGPFKGEPGSFGW